MSYPSGPYPAQPGRPPSPHPFPPQGPPHQMPPQQMPPQHGQGRPVSHYRPQPSDESRRDVEAALAARAELGPEYEREIAAGLAERMEELAAYRVAELRHQSAHQSSQEEMERVAQRQRFVLGIISLGVGIPITGISATTVDPGLLGIAVAWAGIVGVNLAAAWRGRRG